MNWLDLLILAVVIVSTATAFFKGILVELFSLAGVVFGFLVAAADYGALGSWARQWVPNPEVANLIAFLAIAFGTMILAGLVGKLLRGAVRKVGLGFLDRLLGAIFGFIRGLALVTVAVIALAAFLPEASWLKDSRLVPFFLDAAHGGSQMTPYEFGEKIREGVDILRAAQPRWLNSGMDGFHCPYTGTGLIYGSPGPASRMSPASIAGLIPGHGGHSGFMRPVPAPVENFHAYAFLASPNARF